jgi:hypothetical protein
LEQKAMKWRILETKGNEMERERERERERVYL